MKQQYYQCLTLIIVQMRDKHLGVIEH
jgi:hypothetical protein